jgi:uncharacterized protein
MAPDIYFGIFEWDSDKEAENLIKHGIAFRDVVEAFHDPQGFPLRDEKHSIEEDRWFYFGILKGKVITIRFTYRFGRIRIIGAGYWEKGENLYEKEN